MATGGRLGPINGFIFQNARDTGTYVYPVVINGNGDAVWRGDDAGVGVAVGDNQRMALKDWTGNIHDGDTVQFGFEQSGQTHAVNDQEHKFEYQETAMFAAKFTYTGQGAAIAKMEYDGLINL